MDTVVGTGVRLGAHGAQAETLTALQVKQAAEPGMLSDGGSLYLSVSKTSARSWIYRFMLHRKPHDMGLGSAGAVSLAEARDLRDDAGKQVRKDMDPIAARKAQRQAAELEAAKAMTFKDCAKMCIADRSADWTNAQHAWQ